MGLVLSAQGTFAQVTTDNPVVLLAHEPDIYVKVPPRVASLAAHREPSRRRVGAV
jgi:uncharacterized protein